MRTIINNHEIQNVDHEYTVWILDDRGTGTKKAYNARSEPEAIKKALSAWNKNFMPAAARVEVTFMRPAY